MCSMLKYFVLLFTCLQLVENANILFVTVSPSVSHQIVFQPIWKELSLRGHKVTVITPNPLRDPKLTNLTEVDVSDLYGVMKKYVPTDLAKHLLKKPDFLTVFLKDSVMTKLFSLLGEEVFQHPEVQKFLKEDHKFDVAVIEWLFPTMAAFGAKYNVPIVGITSLGAPIPALDTVGNPSHPAFAPDHNLPVGRDMTFRERLMSGLYAVYVRLYYHWAVLPREDKVIKKYLGEDLPYIGDIERNISLLLLNRNPVFHRIMPTVPAVIELGGMKVNRTKQVMDKELKQFMDNSKKGTIYFSLGSNMRSILLPKERVNTLFTVFSQLPWNVVWKWEDENYPGKSENILYQKWLPQTELLGHKNMRLFITQGGLQSTEDAIMNNVPIIGIPFHSDQTTNVATCEKYGMGIALDMDDITVENLNASIYEIMSKPSYKENAKKVSELLYDQPIDGLTRAVWWIEYVIRHQGAKHLRTHAMDISWAKYLMLDVMGFLLTVVAVLLLVIYLLFKVIVKMVKKVFSLICKSCGCKKIKGNNNKKKNE